MKFTTSWFPTLITRVSNCHEEILTKDLLESSTQPINPRSAAIALVVRGEESYERVAVVVGDGPVAGWRQLGIDYVDYLLASPCFHVSTI